MLTELQSQVLSLRLDGLTRKQIGERLGRDEKAVDSVLQQIRKKGALPWPDRYYRLTVKVPYHLRAPLDREARRRGMTPTALAERILHNAVADNLYNAVLEE